MGNREVPRTKILRLRAHVQGARSEPIPEERGPRGKHGFPRATEPKAEAA